MLKPREIIGFPLVRDERRFELIAEVHRQRQAEITRLSEIAAQLTTRFGAETAVRFLYCEMVGRLPERENLRAVAERLRRTPSMVPVIVEDLLALSQQ
jgi:hypothetical protein